MPAWLPPAISAVGGLVGQWFNARQQRKDYREMQQYNSPAAQMQRYGEAGLSPYLIYGQGNPGNVNSPAPSYQFGQQGLQDYMAFVGFQNQIQESKLRQDNMLQQNDILHKKSGELTIGNIRKQLDMWSDYPNMGWLKDDLDKDNVVSTGFRRKINELKLSASQAMLEKLDTTIQNMRYKNTIDAVRAKYADEYGMVGGDWTQGIGLLKSLPGMFRKGARTVSPQHKELIRSYDKFKGDQYRRNANRFLFENLKP